MGMTRVSPRTGRSPSRHGAEGRRLPRRCHAQRREGRLHRLQLGAGKAKVKNVGKRCAATSPRRISSRPASWSIAALDLAVLDSLVLRGGGTGLESRARAIVALALRDLPVFFNGLNRTRALLFCFAWQRNELSCSKRKLCRPGQPRHSMRRGMADKRSSIYRSANLGPQAIAACRNETPNVRQASGTRSG